MCIIFGVPRLPIRPCDERPPAMYGHFCLVPRVSVHDRYYCINNCQSYRESYRYAIMNIKLFLTISMASDQNIQHNMQHYDATFLFRTATQTWHLYWTYGCSCFADYTGLGRGLLIARCRRISQHHHSSSTGSDYSWGAGWISEIASFALYSAYANSLVFDQNTKQITFTILPIYISHEQSWHECSTSGGQLMWTVQYIMIRECERVLGPQYSSWLMMDSMLLGSSDNRYNSDIFVMLVYWTWWCDLHDRFPSIWKTGMVVCYMSMTHDTCVDVYDAQLRESHAITGCALVNLPTLQQLNSETVNFKRRVLECTLASQTVSTTARITIAISKRWQ